MASILHSCVVIPNCLLHYASVYLRHHSSLLFSTLVVCFSQQLLSLLLRTALLCRCSDAACLIAEIKIKGLAALGLFGSLALGLDKISSAHTSHQGGGGTSVVYSPGGTLHLQNRHTPTHTQTISWHIHSPPSLVGATSKASCLLASI